MRRLLGFVLTATVVLTTASDVRAANTADSPLDVRPLLVGAEIPDLTLTAADGESFDLRAATAERRAIVIFYRGGW